MKYTFILIAAAALGLISCKQSVEMTQPNIIYIMSDDHAAHAISAYGGILHNNKSDNIKTTRAHMTPILHNIYKHWHLLRYQKGEKQKNGYHTT